MDRFPIPDVTEPDGAIHSLAPADEGVALGSDVWVPLGHEWGMHRYGDSYLMRIDANDQETIFELKGCTFAGRPALWPGHAMLVIPCLGALDSNGPAGNGVVLLFDATSGSVVQTWPAGGALGVVVAGDIALVAEQHVPGALGDPGSSGPVVINLATGQLIKGPTNEDAICVGSIALTGLNNPAAILACWNDNTTEKLVPLDGHGAATGSTTLVPSGTGFALYSATQQLYTDTLRDGLYLVSPTGAPPRLVVSGQDIPNSDTVAGSIYFIDPSRTSLSRVRDSGNGPVVQESVPIDSLCFTMFGTTANEAWVASYTYLERVRFP